MGPTNILCDALIDAGLLPADYRDRCTAWKTGYDNLLPELLHHWDEFIDNAVDNASQHHTSLRDWLERSVQARAALARCFPRAEFRPTFDWLGDRLTWWPRGIPLGRRVGLASSRLGRKLDQQQTWFTVLRAACAKVDSQRDVLLAATDTTTARFVQRCGELFGLRVMRLEITEPPDVSLACWSQQIRQLQVDMKSHVYTASLSPRFDKNDRSDADLADVPHRDRAVVALSDRLIVLHARRGGHQDRLLRRRLADARWPAASVFIALGPGLVERDLADELMDLGAVGWMVMDSAADADNEAESIRGPTDKVIRSPAPIIPVPSSANWLFLTHCTRRRNGPWPDQDECEFLDDLILDRDDAKHSPLAALRRIIDHNRIVATCSSIRGAVRVVSLTEVPLDQLSALRTFRPHRGHWDFEPYGLCLRRDWLKKRGARAVTYGDESLWSQMSEQERTFFQLRQTTATTSRPSIDWSIEREWRCIGDIELNDLPADAGLVFVPTQREAEQLSQLSRWPIVVVPSPTSAPRD